MAIGSDLWRTPSVLTFLRVEKNYQKKSNFFITAFETRVFIIIHAFIHVDHRGNDVDFGQVEKSIENVESRGVVLNFFGLDL